MLCSEDDAIRPEKMKEFLFYFELPDDLRGRDFLLEAMLYGLMDYNYTEITDGLPLYADEKYGSIPCDIEQKWFLAHTSSTFHSSPELLTHIFGVVTGATNGFFVNLLLASERIKQAFHTIIGYYFLMFIFVVAYFVGMLLLASYLL